MELQIERKQVLLYVCFIIAHYKYQPNEGLLAEVTSVSISV